MYVCIYRYVCMCIYIYVFTYTVCNDVCIYRHYVHIYFIALLANILQCILLRKGFVYRNFPKLFALNYLSAEVVKG